MNSIPYGRQSIDQDDINAVVSTLQSDYLTQGPKVKEFEDKFAEYVGAKYAVAVNNATSGLHLAVLSLGLKKGERVITTPITFAASANCIRYAGGEVWFADIDESSYLLSLENTRKLIESKPKGFFKGIIPVDFAGLPLDLEAFRELANEHGLWIIEDACHAPGGYFNDSKGLKNFCGNGNYADIGVFSFHPVKHIACGEGGMLTTNNPELANIARRFTSLGYAGVSGKQAKITRRDIQDPNYNRHISVGYNYRMSEVQSAVMLGQLERIKELVDIRIKVGEIFDEAIEGSHIVTKQHNKTQNNIVTYEITI